MGTLSPESPAARKIWLDMDQKTLDDAYDQAVYAPNMGQVIERMVTASADMRQRLGEPQSFQYGPSPIEKLHYFPAPRASAPIHVHVHGGAWKQRKADSIFFPAEAFINAGIGFAIFDFSGVDESGGDLRLLGEQVTRALVWLAKQATQLGGDPTRLFVSGFSSGAHLAGVAMTANWESFGFHGNPYRGALLASGMYDLYPVSLSKRSQYVNFPDDIVETMSPQRHLEAFDVPVILAHGSCETPEFQRQTREFAEQLSAAGASVEYLECQGFNHYEIMENFGNPYGPIGRAALGQVLRSQ